MFSILSSKGIFSNRFSTSSLAINLLELNLPSSVAMQNKSWTAYHSRWEDVK